MAGRTKKVEGVSDVLMRLLLQVIENTGERGSLLQELVDNDNAEVVLEYLTLRKQFNITESEY